MEISLREITEFYEKYPEYKGKVKVKTRKGYYPITNAGITAYNSEIIKIDTGDEKIEGSPNHRIIKKGEWTKIKNLKTGDSILTKSGYKKITKKKLDFKEDLYDIEVKEVKEYYSNNIVSHNSTFADALFYSLFGKPFRKIKTATLVNRINKKNLEVHLEFYVDSKLYKIIRAQKPNKFEIYEEQEGELKLIEQRAATKDYQKFLEEEILKLNETIFRQLIVLGSNLPSSKPFMELSQSEKESLFQVLTDTSIFGYIKTVIKTRLSDNKQSIKDLEYKRDILKASLDSEQLMIDRAEKQNKDFETHHINNLSKTKEEIADTNNSILKYREALIKLKNLKTEYDSLMFELTEKQNKLEFQKQVNSKEIVELREKNMLKYQDLIRNCTISEDEMLKQQEKEQEIQSLKNEIYDLNIEESKLDRKIKNIEAAEQNSIICSSCEAVNYLTEIEEQEIINKEKYLKEKTFIIDKTKLKIKQLKGPEGLEKALKEFKESIQKRILENKNSIEKKKHLLDAAVSETEKKLEEKLKPLTEELSGLQSKTDNIKSALLNGKRIKETLSEQEQNLEYLENKMKELQSIKPVTIDYTSIEEKETNLKCIQKDLKSTLMGKDNLLYLDTLVNGNNLKGAVIKKQIPFLNKGINHFLELFSLLEYSFIIDENFKERIISRDSDSEFNSLSNGQKARISFSVMFSFLKLIEERNGVKTNILVLDEILDSSVDASGREELLGILKEEFSETKNIFIISHNPEIKEKVELFDRLIHITMDKFSKLRIEELN